ncbi:MAG: hypothetical protein ACOYT8_05585 [Candidatus Dependentiae bacterium]
MKKLVLFLGILLIIPQQARTEIHENRGIPLTIASLVAAGIGYGSWKLCTHCLDKLDSKNLSKKQALTYKALTGITSAIAALCCCASPLLLAGAIQELNEEFGYFETDNDNTAIQMPPYKELLIQEHKEQMQREKILKLLQNDNIKKEAH